MAQAHKDPASRRGSSGSNHGGSRAVGLVNAEGGEDGVKVVSGIVQLMTNLHHNAAAVVTSKVIVISSLFDLTQNIYIGVL